MKRCKAEGVKLRSIVVGVNLEQLEKNVMKNYLKSVGGLRS